MITIVLADDHHVVRQALRVLLESEPDFTVVGETADGLKVADLVEEFAPNVLVVDLMMPGLSGFEIIRQVSQRLPGTRALCLSMYADEEYVLRALRSGAAGYVLKGDDASELIAGVRQVAAGGRYLSASLSGILIDAYLRGPESHETDPYERLTGREREVLQLMAEGSTNAEIGQRLFISPRTVETHRAHVMRKLGLHSQTDVVHYALRRGLLPPNHD